MPPPPQTTDSVLSRTFEVAPGGRCRVRVPRAAIVLSGEAGSEASGEAEVTITAAEGTDPEAARALAGDLRVRYAEGVLRVEPEHPPRMDAGAWRALREGPPALRIRVRVPAGFGADVHASGGAIDASGLGGPVTLEAHGGTIRAAGLSGRLDVHARRCQTTLTDFSGKKLSAHVHGGRFAARGARAERVEIESAAGHLQLERIEAALHLAAQNGQARLAKLRGALDAEVYGGRLSFAPENGHATRLHAPGSSVHLRLPDGFAAALHLSAGRLELASLDGFEGERSTRQAEGVLNDGGASFRATAPGGTLRCEPAPDDGR